MCGRMYTQVMVRKPMTHKTIRIPDQLWEDARDAADRRDETVSDAIRRFLEGYVRRNQK